MLFRETRQFNQCSDMKGKAKKRKMEPHIGGDNCQEPEQKLCQNPPTGSASGDFDGDEVHQFVASVSDVKFKDSESYKLLRQGCELGDEWEQKYPIPLSNYPERSMKTGNAQYDSFVSDLGKFGYRPLQVIAKGRSGTILLAQNIDLPNGCEDSEYIPVAVKLNTGKARRKYWKSGMLEEMAILKTLSHPSIISWICTISHDGRVGYVMEFCENGNLEQLLRIYQARFLTEPLCHKYFQQIFDGIEYLHFQNIAHRDMCTHNILITRNNTLKIADFGHAVYYITGDPLRKDECGSTGFQAPEIIAKNPYNPKLADFWSLGSILYLMATGNYPLGLIRKEILSRASKEIQFPEDRVLRLSPSLKDLLRGLLAFVPETRFSLNRIKFTEWMLTQNTNLQIGNFHLIRQPRKIKEGLREKELKHRYGI